MSASNIVRIFRQPRNTRGNTGITIQQPIDEAAWIWHPALVAEIPGLAPRIVRFRADFEATDEPLVFDLSADERFVLILDGEIVARGPNRGLVENWQYQSYEARLPAGPHRIEAVCWTIGDAAPLAQLSWKGGFVFHAEGAYRDLLSTGNDSGRCAWKAGLVEGTATAPATPGSGAWGTGGTFIENGTGPLDAIPAEWATPVVVRNPVQWMPGSLHYGSRAKGWLLFPSQLPDQVERPIATGAFRAASSAPASEDGRTASPSEDGRTVFGQPYSSADAASPLVAAFNALVRDGAPVTIPPRTVVRALWDLDDYYGAYPVLETSGGAGASIRILFQESLVDAGDGLKHDRNAFIGKRLCGYGDEYRPDGRTHASFTPLWWRTGRWVEVSVETGDAPLSLTRFALLESRYPLERESTFSGDIPSIADIQKICLRGMQMCCHEMLFDCPFYEQQMYPGDTRIQLLVLSALSRDDRMIRRAIEIFAKAAHDDGTVPFNYPTRGLQEGGSYTLCWLLMFGDYAMRHTGADWLRAQIPAMRHTLSGIAAYEDPDGILRNLPGWNFTDWVVENPWQTVSWAPGSTEGDTRRGSILSLFWVLALKSAATTERALGDEAMARYWETKAIRTAKSIVRVFWDKKHGMIADSDAFDHFSEHAQSLAIVADVLPSGKRARAVKALLEAPDLARATVYFSHYLFEAYFAIGRADLFLKRLDLWRHYLDLGLRTPLEAPDCGKNGQKEARSDCHAWGSHPIYWLQTGIAGVSPASPFFKTVRVAPQPGGLKRIETHVPHPDGFIDVALNFAGEKVSGTVSLPENISGVFEYAGAVLPLHPGLNEICGNM